MRTNVWGHSHLWKRRQWNALEGFTHVLVEAGRPLIPGGDWALGDGDIEALQALGLKVGLLWHGTDVRLPSLHMDLEPYSPYRDADPQWVEKLERLAQANHDLADRWGLAEFVSNPYLKAFRPKATWIPTLSNPDVWDAAPSPDNGHLPVVAHIPSQRIWKGTDVIRPILERLQGEGLLRYLDITNVLPKDMPAKIASADIVVDGIVNGQYGVVSLETMLSRRVSVAHTWDSTRQDIEAQSGLQVPVVEADPESFEGVIRDLVSDPVRRLQLGERGREYALDVHGQSRAASALEKFLRTS